MLKTRLDASVRLGRDALYPVPHELLALLRSIRVHGSLIHATKEAGISYRHAWGLLGRWEAITGQKLAVLTCGQGTGLTPFGARLAGIAEWLEPRVHERFDDLGAELARYLDVPVEGEKQRVLVHASPRRAAQVRSYTDLSCNLGRVPRSHAADEGRKEPV